MTGRFACKGDARRRWVFRTVWCLIPVVYAALAGRAFAEQAPASQSAGAIRGTVKDPSGAVVAGAVATLEAAGMPQQQRTTITDQAGQFRFSPVVEGTYKLTITASGFAVWTAETVSPSFDENLLPISAALQVATPSTEVKVSLPPHELAAEQIKAEEKQRVLGVFPNFFVTYEPNAAPLTAKQKFELGWKTFFDPVPILFSGIGAGIQQARKSYPEYGQGVEGFSKRFGANYADRVDDVLIGHVVMQSVFHQDPRYFYKGTGSFGSRVLYAIATAFVAKGDNGHWQPAYSDVLGGIGSYGISTLYRPGHITAGAAARAYNLAGFRRSSDTQFARRVRAAQGKHSRAKNSGIAIPANSPSRNARDADFDGRPEHEDC